MTPLTKAEKQIVLKAMEMLEPSVVRQNGRLRMYNTYVCWAVTNAEGRDNPNISKIVARYKEFYQMHQDWWGYENDRWNTNHISLGDELICYNERLTALALFLAAEGVL